MLGSKTFSIDYSDFIKGMSTSANVPDGGFSSETVALNPITNVGVIYGPPTILDRSSNLINGNVIMSYGDATYTGAQKFLGTDTGYFYSVDGAYVPTQRQAAVAGTYTSGYADMVQYGVGSTVYTFVTNTTNIVRMTGSDLSGLDDDWWTATMSQTALGVNPIGGATGVTAPHPMIVFEDSLWIADFNRLHKFDGTTASYSFLTLPIDQTIIALGIDPSTGKMLISTTQGVNAGDTVPKISKVLLYDGFSPRPLRSVIVDDMVTAFHAVGGTVYTPYGLNLGYWNGAGITFLRKFKNVTYDATNLVYKHKITNVGKNVYCVDTNQILCYGEILPGQRRFYYANKATLGSPSIVTASFNLGSNQLALCYNDGTNKIMGSFDITSTTLVNNLGLFYSLKYAFERRIQVKEILVEYQDSIAASGSGGIVTLINQTGEVVSTTLTNNKTSAQFDISAFPAAQLPTCTYIQLKYEPVSAKGVRRFVVGYDFVD